MIYEYTKQDIPRAWKAGYHFVETDVVPKLSQSSPVSGFDLLKSGDQSTLTFRASLFPMDFSFLQLPGADLMENIVRAGTPLRNLKEKESLRYGVYQTLFSSIGAPSEGFNMYSSMIGDAFGGVKPPSSVDMPHGLSGSEVGREILRRMTPLIDFHVPSDDLRASHVPTAWCFWADVKK